MLGRMNHLLEQRDTKKMIHLKFFLRLRSKMVYRHAPIIIWFNGCWEEWIIRYNSIVSH